jgi:hypothetical protein
MNARRLRLTGFMSLCVVAGMSIFMSVPALAAPQEPETGQPTEVTNTTALLHGTLNPHNYETDDWYFAYNTGASCTGGSTTPIEHFEFEVFDAPVRVRITGLAPNAKYMVCFVERNQADETTVGSPVSFTAKPEAPILEGESFSNVGSTSATLQAQVNPEGTPSTYYFEYGTSTAYGSLTPVSSLGSSTGGVQATLEGLQPDTVYHFRVVTTNDSDQTTVGFDKSFTTFPAGVLGLPDGRSFEVVSLLGNGDTSVVEPIGIGQHDNLANTRLPFRAADDGSGLAYVGTPPAVGGNGSVGDGKGNEYLARRSAAGVWTTASIQPGGLRSPTYQAFSSDLSVGILDSNEALTATAPGEQYDVLYSNNTHDGSYHPFFTTVPSHRSHLEFETPNVNEIQAERLAYVGASSDLSHLLFEANDTLTAEAVDGGPAANNLYDSVDGRLRLVNVLPDGSTDPNATFGSSVSEGGAQPQPDFDHVISDNGSRIFWTDLNTGNLYMRENDTQLQSPVGPKDECTVPADACTVQVDTSQGPGSSGGGLFLTATQDGSRVLFTDESRLTVDSTAAPQAPDLYEYEVQNGRLVDLSVDANTGEHADVQGLLGASEDDSYVYFAAGGALAGGAAHQTCQEESRSMCNVYVLHEGEAPRLVATVLTYQDGGLHGAGGGVAVGDWQFDLGARTARVTPDGAHLIFESTVDLTGYQSDGQKEISEIYMYDSGSGELSCVSCNPSGAPTAGGVELRVSYSNSYMLRDVSGNGDRVFFDSEEALVPRDTNGHVDVYEWEHEGVGSCRREKGCLYLLSDGTSADTSFFLDASENGNDVFISTRAQLVPLDQNEVFDAYDVRVDVPEAAASPVCVGSGCQGVPGAPPIFATPSSVTFDGVGNFLPAAPKAVKSKSKPTKCKRGFVKKGRKCVRRKAKRTKAGGVERRDKGSTRRSK